MAKVRQLLIGLASSSALYSGLVPALGLGEITLHSALSQPLDAEIELFDVGDLTAEDMRVRLAPADVFARSGVDRLYFFNDLRFNPILRGGTSVIRVVATQPVRGAWISVGADAWSEKSWRRPRSSPRSSRRVGLACAIVSVLPQ